MSLGAILEARSSLPQAPLRTMSRSTSVDAVWQEVRAEAEAALVEEPLYAGIIQATVLDQRSIAQAFAYRLAHRLGDGDLSRLAMRDLCLAAFEADPHAGAHAVRDLVAIRERDPTCRRYLDPFLFYKGLAALEGYRVAHWLWHQGRVDPRAAYPEPNLRGVRGRYPPGRANRLGGVHRPRHRGRHRRDHGDRR